MPDLPPPFVHLSLTERVYATLALIERRGYSVRLECLAECLVGGPVTVEALKTVVEASPGLYLDSGLVHTDHLDPTRVRRSLERQQAHTENCRGYWPAVRAYVEQLVARAPQIRCVTLAGSMAAGGFLESDDIDFNLFVEDGTRYTTYLEANLLALGFSLRHRQRPTDAHTRRFPFPKLMSINVIWLDSDTRPFVRQDGPMALELFLSRPLWGEDYFHNVLGCNRWLDDYFPQFQAERYLCPCPRTRSRQVWMQWRERLSYFATYWGWRWVMWARRNNPEALLRVEQVRRYQSPYAFFEGTDGSGSTSPLGHRQYTTE